jgi:nitroreductase
MDPDLTSVREPDSAVVETALRRRSIRTGFTDVPVGNHTIEAIVGVGLAAPSSKAAKPWRFHIVTSRRLLNVLADLVAAADGGSEFVPIDPGTGVRHAWSSTVDESAQVLREAPLGIFIENRGPFSGGRQAVAGATDAHRSNAVLGYGLEMIGHGAAIEGMWLAALSLGLGGVFMGDVLVAEGPIREVLGMDGDLVGVLALGPIQPPQTPAPSSIELGSPDATGVVWHAGESGHPHPR